MSNCGKCSSSCNQHGQAQDDYLIKFYTVVEEEIGGEDYNTLKSKLISLPAVKEVRVEDNRLEILYDDVMISPEEIERVIEGL